MAKQKCKKSVSRRREFIGVLFRCCGTYSRVYVNASGKAFVGWCPKCTEKVEFKISPYGSRSSFFESC